MINKDFLKIACSAVLVFFPFAVSHAEEAAPFESQISPIPSAIKAKMEQSTWHEGCPVPISDLSYIKLSYWGFDHRPHSGELIVNSKVAPEVVAIFKTLYEDQFPIERMSLMESFKGDDAAAMAVNNTSGFNCRGQTGHPGVYSWHSYGLAVDINPVVNPYVKGDTVLPPDGRHYVERKSDMPGLINKDGPVLALFAKQGWQWGGDWKEQKDYQHFEKPMPELLPKS